jgi:hypothetical protein
MCEPSAQMASQTAIIISRHSARRIAVRLKARNTSPPLVPCARVAWNLPPFKLRNVSSRVATLSLSEI